MPARSKTNRRGARRAWRAASAVALLLGASALPSIGLRAGADEIGVNCDTATDDIDAVQQAIDGAADGSVVRLQGTCDFAAAPAHGGDVASIDATAVLVHDVTDLTITSLSTTRATIRGSGSQTAVAVAPSAGGTTITGLDFETLARPVVVLGADNVTIGAANLGGVPSAAANRIEGQLTMDSAILAVASSSPMTVGYGHGPSAASASFTPAALDNLAVGGNVITYTPPGLGDPADAADIVAIDVRQRGTATITGVNIRGNAVGMFGSEFVSTEQNSIRVQGLTAATDHRITDVHVVGNNLGRFDLLPDGAVSGVDPNEAHFAGRLGVALIRVRDFEVRNNEVRTRLSSTATATPGGGIVASDSSDGTIRANSVLVVASPGTATSDLGAIGVVQGLPRLNGDLAADQDSSGVLVTQNVIGAAPNSPIGAQRGLVISGPDLVTAFGNSVVSSSADALFVGAPVQGPTGATLPTTVTRSVLCANSLDGGADTADEVTFTDGVPASVANAFPNGAVTGGAGNMSCPPTLAAAPSRILSGQSLTLTGRSWASRTVKISIFDSNDTEGPSVVKTGTASSTGSYSIVVTPSELHPVLTDGPLHIVATAVDPAGLELSSAFAQVRKNAANTGNSAFFLDGGDGYPGFASSTELTVGLPSEWLAPDGAVKAVDIWWSRTDGSIPHAECGPYHLTDSQYFSSTANMHGACAVAFADGPMMFKTQWTFEGPTAASEDDSLSPIASDTTIKDTVVTRPVIIAPTDGAVFSTNTLTVSGTAEPNGKVTVWEGFPGNTIYASDVPVDGSGNWSVNLTFAEGDHDVTAYQVDQAGNQSASADVITVIVDTSPEDITPPPAPFITSPSPNALLNSTIQASGTVGEGNVTIWLYRVPGTQTTPGPNDEVVTAGTADMTGNWTTAARENYVAVCQCKLYAVAIDAAGNRSGPSAFVPVDIEGEPPTVRIFTPEFDEIFLLSQPVTVTGDAIDVSSGLVSIELAIYQRASPGGGFNQVPVHGWSPVTCPSGCAAGPNQLKTFNYDVPTLPIGQYRIVVRATDPRGNVGYALVDITKVP